MSRKNKTTQTDPVNAPESAQKPAAGTGSDKKTARSAAAEGKSAAKLQSDPYTAITRRTVRINGRFFLMLVLLFVALGAGTYALHNVQMQRNSKTLWTMALEAEDNDQLDKAISYLQQYLRFEPTDHDAKVRLADVVGRRSRDFRSRQYVFRLLEDVLRNDPERADAAKLRLRVVKLAIEIRRYRAGLDHVKLLGNQSHEQTMLEGVCRQGLGEYRDAVFTYLRAIDQAEKTDEKKSDESTIEPYVLLASLLSFRPEALPYQEDVKSALPQVSADLRGLFPERKSTKSTRVRPPVTALRPRDIATPDAEPAERVAQKLYQRMADKGRPAQQAQLAVASYLLSRRRFEAAQRAIDAAQAIAPNDPDVLLAASHLALRRAQDAALKEGTESQQRDYLTQARRIARRAAQLKGIPVPKRLAFLLQLASVGQQQSRLADLSPRDQKQRLEAAKAHLATCEAELEKHRKTAEAKKPENAGTLRQLEISLVSQQIELLFATTNQDTKPLSKDDKETLEGYYARLQRLGAAPVQLGLFTAQQLLAQRNWPAAVSALLAARRTVGNSQSLRRKIDLSLADCYRRLRNPVSRIQILRQGLSSDTHWTEGRVLLAAALESRGWLDEAIKEYNASGRPLAALQLQLRKLARRPADQRARGLQLLKRALDQLRKNLPSPDDRQDIYLTLLDVELIALDPAKAGTRNAEIEKLLQSAIQRHTAAAKKDESARQKQARLEPLLAARVRFEAGRGDRDKTQRIDAALKLLDASLKSHPGSVVLQTTKARLALLLPEPQAAKQLAALVGDIEANSKLTKAEKAAVLETVAHGFAAIHSDKQDHLKDCRLVWNKVKALSPHNLAVHLASAELAIRQNDQKTLAADLQVIDGIEKPEPKKGEPLPVGVWGNYYRALSLIATAGRKFQQTRQALAKLTPAQKKQLAESVKADGKAIEKHLKEARTLLTEAVNAQPLWPRLHRTLGRVEALLLDQDTAYKHYDRAFELRDRSVQTCTFILQYLTVEKKDFNTAYERLKTIKADAGHILMSGGIDLTGKAPSITQLAVGLEARRGELASARRLLRNDDPGYQTAILRAKLLFLDYQTLNERDKNGPRGKKYLEDAEKELRKAVKDGKDSPAPWIAWVQQLAVLKRTKEAEQRKKLTKEAEDRIAEALKVLPEKVKHITAAYCYFILNDEKNAEKYFLLAVSAQPNDNGLKLRLARFYAATRQLAKAIPVLETVQKSKSATDTQKAVARHMVVLAKAGSGTYNDFTQALESLGNPGTATKADLLTRVRLLTASPLKKDRLALIATLEELDRRFKALADGDRFNLARLYEKAGRWKDARKVIDDLLERKPGDAGLLGWYAVEILKNEPHNAATLAQARKLHSRLADLQPNSLATAMVQANLVLAEKKDTEQARKEAAKALQAATKRLGKSGKKLTAAENAQLRLAAQYCETNHLLPLAESLHRRYAKEVGKPEAMLAVATFLARTGRHAEALQIVREAEKAKPVTRAVAAANIVSVGRPTDADIAAAKAIVARAAKAEPKSVQIRWQTATLLTAEGKLAESEAVYRELLKTTKGHYAVANNLAWLLAMRNDKLDEAKILIDQIITEKGPIGEFLDTRALILVRMERPADAVKDLQAAVEETTDPEKYLHLAQALLKLNNRPAAVEAMQQAKKLGLTFNRLHRLEHEEARKALQATGVTLADW